MRRLVVVAAVLPFALVGCGEDNTDPRKGVVMIDQSNCLFGECYELSKVCIGPDLLTHYYNGGEETDRKDENSPECAS